MKRDEIVISPEDAAVLGALLEGSGHRRAGDEALKALAETLDAADVASPMQLPRSTVSLGTIVEYAELHGGRTCSFELVLPAKADVGAGRVSVLSPVGRALLGKKLGSVVEIRLPSGDKRQVKVMGLRAGAADG